MMLAHDVNEAASQTFYSKYAAVNAVNGGYRVTFDAVDKVDSELVRKEFYVSLKGGEQIKACDGGSFILAEKREDHDLYKIVRNEGVSAVVLKI